MKIFGQNPKGKHLEKLKSSPNYKNGAFQNFNETVMMPDESMLQVSLKFFRDRTKKTPPKPVPFVRTDLKKIGGHKPTIVWFGHSSYLINIHGKNILVDPVFSGSASPFSFTVKAFPGANEYDIPDFPKIDLLVLTHDHYDHLDYNTVLQLRDSDCKIFCSAGVGSHLQYWNFDESRIMEFDWWETNRFDENIEFTAAPARHFSGRGTTRGKTLWSSFILKSTDYKLYLGGDSGYDTHFKEIGEKHGPFDLALLECGQYNRMWRYIHMMPEQTVQASIDLKAKVLLPVHWGKFSLAMHTWNEPIIRATAEAKKLGVNIVSPMIGEAYELHSKFSGGVWWE